MKELEDPEFRVPVVAQQLMNPTSIREDLLSGLRIWHCHELWCSSQMWLRSGVAVVVV